MDAIWQNLPVILVGLRLTIQYSIVAIVLMVVIGLIAALMRLSAIAPLRWIATAYVEIFRSTPLLVQLFFIVLGCPPSCRSTNGSGNCCTRSSPPR